MRAGPLRDRIALDAPDTGRDGMGAPKRNWEFVWECAAQIETLSGREYFTGSREEATETVRIRIRYPPRNVALNAGWRARDVRRPGITYAITAVLFDARRSMVTLACQSGNSDG